MDEMNRVVAALKTVRAGATCEEYDLHRLVSLALDQAGISYTHEARVAPGARIDFLAGNVGIEVKKRAGRALLMRQARKYLACDSVSCLVVAAQHGVDLPARISGKPVVSICLNRNWGIAL